MSLPEPLPSYGLKDATSQAVRAGTLHVLTSALRVHQWIKNLLIFVPLLMAHKILDGPSLMRSIYGFLAWCFCASGVYLINDWFDIDADRQHPYKKHRRSPLGGYGFWFQSSSSLAWQLVFSYCRPHLLGLSCFISLSQAAIPFT